MHQRYLTYQPGDIYDYEEEEDDEIVKYAPREPPTKSNFLLITMFIATVLVYVAGATKIHEKVFETTTTTTTTTTAPPQFFDTEINISDKQKISIRVLGVLVFLLAFIIALLWINRAKMGAAGGRVLAFAIEAVFVAFVAFMVNMIVMQSAVQSTVMRSNLWTAVIIAVSAIVTYDFILPYASDFRPVVAIFFGSLMMIFMIRNDYLPTRDSGLYAFIALQVIALLAVIRIQKIRSWRIAFHLMVSISLLAGLSYYFSVSELMCSNYLSGNVREASQDYLIACEAGIEPFISYEKNEMLKSLSLDGCTSRCMPNCKEGLEYFQTVIVPECDALKQSAPSQGETNFQPSIDCNSVKSYNLCQALPQCTSIPFMWPILGCIGNV